MRIKYVPVAFSRKDAEDIPYFLRSTTYHVVTPGDLASYRSLLRQLLGRPTAVPAPLGSPPGNLAAVPVPAGDQDETRAGDAGGRPELPAAVRLLDILGQEPTDPDHLVGRWRAYRQHPGQSGVIIGMGAEGAIAFDPATEGPHCMVVGTTGSGKSTLLRTLIASLALSYPPDAWRFLLVDYKGGGAFAGLDRLPHTIGTITELGRWASRRMRTMLRAEMRRRERAMLDAEAPNFSWYRARRDGVGEAGIPRLLVVVDEFASLAYESPEAIDGLIEVGMRGRSLGIHLILSTQRPAAVVSAKIQANMAARICFRVASDADSAAVIGSPAAAHLPRSVPGRALMSLNGPRLVPVQVADLPAAGESEEPPTEAVVRAVLAGATHADFRRVLPRWPPPLPSVVDLDRTQPTPAAPGEFSAPVGIADIPESLTQVPWSIDLDRCWAVIGVGSRGAGKTTWLKTVAESLAARYGGADWELLVADLDGGLANLARLPQCRAASQSDPALARDVVLLADAELTKRSIEARLSAAGQDPRRLVVAVDRLDVLLESDSGTELLAAVKRLAAGGPSRRLYLLATVDFAGAARRDLAMEFPHRLLLRLGHPSDYVWFGLGQDEIPEPQPPGRGLWLPDRLEVQVARVST